MVTYLSRWVDSIVRQARWVALKGGLEKFHRLAASETYTNKYHHWLTLFQTDAIQLDRIVAVATYRVVAVLSPPSPTKGQTHSPSTNTSRKTVQPHAPSRPRRRRREQR